MMPATTTYERAGRPADLESRSTQRRDQEAGDDRAVNAGLGRQPRRDREGHRQRQRDEADGEAGDQIGKEVTPGIRRPRSSESIAAAIPEAGARSSCVEGQNVAS
jgi:hypothetical protein